MIMKGSFQKNFIVPTEMANNFRMERVLHLVISDTHFGSEPKPQSHQVKYSESRRMAGVVKQTIEYKRDHRDATILAVHVLGDIIEGKLHDAEFAAPDSLQFMAALSYLKQAIECFAEHFPFVMVFCVPGNHGRTSSRHKERARSDKWDSAETKLYSALRESVDHFTNVQTELFGSLYFVQFFGHTVFGTHGDTVFDPGLPHKKIDVKSIENQLIRLNIRHKPISVAITGHTHQAAYLPLSGTVCFVNPALVPVLEYSQSIGVFNSRCGCWLFEMTEKYPVGDVRLATVGKFNDDDKQLDRLIKPFNYRSSKL